VFLATLKIPHTASSPTPWVRELNTSTMKLMGFRIEAMTELLVKESHLLQDLHCMIALSMIASLMIVCFMSSALQQWGQVLSIS
jgi:hypothetical protein